MLKDPYSAAQFILELGEKQKVGFCRSVEGGGVKADILTYRAIQGGDPKGNWSFNRQIAAKPKFEDIKLQVGMSMSESFYEWIESFFSGGTNESGEIIRQTGAIVAGDFHMKERSRREFYDALISEVAIPKLDASDRNAAYMGVTIVPEAVLFNADHVGDPLDHELGHPNQKLWTPNNFSFTFDGFDDALKRVSRVDGFTIKQQILEYHAGYGEEAAGGALVASGGPGVIRMPGMIEFPNIAVYVPEVDAKPLIDHFYKYGVVHHHVETDKRTGSLRFLSHEPGGIEMKELCQISMEGMEIASIVPDRADSTSHDVKHVKIEFACERMQFTYTQKNQGRQQPEG